MHFNKKHILLLILISLFHLTSTAQLYGYFGRNNGIAIKTQISAHMIGLLNGSSIIVGEEPDKLTERIANNYRASNIKHGFGFEYFRILSNRLKIGGGFTTYDFNVFHPSGFFNTSSKFHLPQNANLSSSYRVLDLSMIRAKRQYIELFTEFSANKNQNVAFSLTHRLGIRLGQSLILSESTIVQYRVEDFFNNNSEIEYRETPMDLVVNSDEVNLNHIQLLYAIAGQIMINKSLALRTALNINIGPNFITRDYFFKNYKGNENSSNSLLFHPDEFKHMVNYQLFSNFLTLDIGLNYAF